MLIKKASDIRYSEVTPKHLFINRRRFLTGTAAARFTLVIAVLLSYRLIHSIVPITPVPRAVR
jgi:hypothetical protein